MRRVFFILWLTLLFPITTLAQAVIRDTLSATKQVSSSVDLRGTGVTQHTMTWNTNPTVTAGACRLEYADTAAFTSPQQLIAPQTVTSSGGPAVATMVVNFVRVSCNAPGTPIAGAGTVAVRYDGSLPTSGGGGGGGNVSVISSVLPTGAATETTLATRASESTLASINSKFYSQGSTTTGQVGGLAQCAVTTAAPVYTTGQTAPCSLDTGGGLRVSGIAGGGGGTSSNFTSAFPTAGTAIGFTDGTNMQAARVFDLDTGAGLQYIQGVSLRLSGAGGSVEFGTATAPVRIDPIGTTIQPVSGTVTANAGTGNFNVVQQPAVSTTTTMQNAVTAAGNGTVLNVDGMAVARLTAICTVSCTTPATITLTAQNDGTNFTNVYGTVDNSNTITNAFQVGTTIPVSISVQLHGEKQLRAAITSYTNGTINVIGTASAAPGNPPPVVNANIVSTNATVNVTQLGNNPIDTNTGNASAGTQRFVLATSQPNLTTPLNVTVSNTAVPMNITQVGGNPITTSAAGVLNVSIRDSNNAPILATANPCSGSLTTLIVGSVTADTQLITTAGAGIRRYYCSIAINNGDAAANEKVSIVESTTGGGTCTVAPSAVWGSTTDANGWLVSSAGGGFIHPVMEVGPLTNAATCLKVNTGGLQIDYIITYVQQ